MKLTLNISQLNQNLQGYIKHFKKFQLLQNLQDDTQITHYYQISNNKKRNTHLYQIL